MSDTIVTIQSQIQTLTVAELKPQTIAIIQPQLHTLTTSGQSISVPTIAQQQIQTLSDINTQLVVVDNSQVQVITIGSQGPTGQGVPAGGTTGQYLKKNSATHFDTGWGSLGALATKDSVDLSTTDVSGDLSFSNIAQIASAVILGRNSTGTGDIESMAVSTVKTMLGYHLGMGSGEITISAQSIGASGTYTQNISLTKSDWTNGVLIVKDNSSGNIASGALIHFTDTTSESAGISGAITYAGSSNIGSLQARLNVTDGVVTGSAFLGAAGQASIVIKSVRISGANIEVIWKNNSGANQNINAKLRYYLFRGDKVTA